MPNTIASGECAETLVANMTDEKLKVSRFPWVRMGDQGPVICWGPVSMLAGGTLIGYLIAQTFLCLYLDVPFRLGMLSALFSAQLAFFATLVELQRQNLKPGKSAFRFNLTYLFILTLLIAVFFASIMSDFRTSQRGFERNEVVKAELEKLMGGGNVYMGAPNGKRITCEVTRKDFSDSDLRSLIKASRGIDSDVSELIMLVLESTAVTENGLQSISTCKKLEILALPAITLSDATLESLAKCKNLKFLTLDQKKLSAAQIDLLSEKLPNTKINGVSYREKQAATKK